jgi:N12 class adenine-specific DNA methylase
VPVFPDIAALARYVAAAGPAGPGDVSAYLRGVARTDPVQPTGEQLRLAHAAIAGRGRNTREFDLDRARAALIRLAEHDPTLPANSLGQRIEISENDPTDNVIRIVSGRALPPRQRPVMGPVVEIQRGYGGSNLQLIIERDDGADERGAPYATTQVAADAVLTLVTAGASHPVQEAGQTRDPPASPVSGEEIPADAAGLSVGDGRWSRRITIEVTGGTAVVSGTDRSDPALLRQALKDNGFRWRPQEGHVWRFVPRRDGPGRDAAVQAVRDALVALDVQEAANVDSAPSYPPTAQQQAIIEACLAGRDVAVRALAGTGKTSTMRMVAAGMPDKTITYIAFNRSIADEAQAAFGRNVRADTMHAFARQALRSNPRYQDKLAKVAVNDGFPTEIAAALGLDAEEAVAYGPLESQRIEALALVRLALGTVKRFREGADAELGPRHVGDGAVADQAGLRALVLDYARRIWADKTSPTGELRFTHDDYLKIWALGSPTVPGDVIVFDEVQDVNELQARLVQAQAAQTIVVGDSYQSIYGFRGAKDFLSSWPAEVTLPLTQSWRFGPAVAETGNRFLRLLRSPLELEGNPALDTRLEPVENPDAVLCRTNAGAVAAVFAAIEEGKRVALVGGGGAIKDIARAAKDLQRGRSTRHPDLTAFASWSDVRDYVNQHEDAQSLRMFVQLIDRHGPDGLIEMASDLVDEDATDPQLRPDLVVSTAHKAKGREWDNVRIAEDFKGPAQDPETGETVLPSPEELRLAYVTVTRAQRSLDLGSLAWVLDHGEPNQQPTATPLQRQAHEEAAARPADRTTQPARDVHRQPGSPPQEPAVQPAERSASRGPGPHPPSGEPAPDVATTSPEVATTAPRFRPSGQQDLAPSGPLARVRANIAALQTLRALQAEQRPANADEQRVLARWSGWGAVPQVFDTDRAEFAWARDELTRLLGPEGIDAAKRNTLNAHYTDFDLAAPIWSALRELGFTGGRVLEPGCGSGNFIGTAPPGAQVVGVEVELVTAGIAAALYPDAEIRAESFAVTRAPAGSFDLTVGNVPFAKAALHDRQHNPGGHSIHNHFILKSLHLTAPGGLVAVITSRYTLDAQNPAARREMAQLADLVGAIRLPRAAHQQAAGTQVVTDLLVFRRREHDFEPQPVDWELTEGLDLDGQQVRVNSYFMRHPEMVCGELAVGRGQFSDSELTVGANRPAPELLEERLRLLVDRARAAELTHSPTVERPAPRRAALVGDTAMLRNGHLLVAGEEFAQVHHGAAEPHPVPKSQGGELRALLGLRDTVVELLEAEAASAETTPRIEQLRDRLGARYDRYLAQYGPLNRFSWRRTGRVNDAGEQIRARVFPPQGGFRSDPASPLVYALENFDSATGRATKADIFTQRVVAPRAPRLGADTPADALAICMDVRGRVDLDEIARLLGLAPSEAREVLGQLVFEDPGQDGQLVPAAEYLSGHVRDKLAAAHTTAADDPRYQPNVAALTEVIPPDIAPEDIRPRLGAAWIDQRYIQQFLRDLLDDEHLVAEHAYGASWTVKGNEYGVTATSTWGTPDFPGPRLAEALLEQRAITVHDVFEVSRPGGGTTTRRVLNVAKTVAAQAKGDEIAARFTDWVWEDPQRATELARTYNHQFNSLALRSYDDVELSLPGLALTFKPNPHQIAAVARMRSEPAVGLYHEVGAGKTAEMAMGVMELRRLGTVGKPAIVVPNHMLEQFTREFQQLYPRAKLLAASSADLTKDKRRAFVARIATGDWDAVIMTRGAFERIPMSPDAEAAYLNDQLSELRAAIERKRAAGAPRSFTLKRMENSLLNAEERLKKKIDREHDPAVSFEHSGIDYVVVDEAHDYKNLRTVSNIAGAAIDGSGRASDLEMKLHYLRSRHGSRVVTLATATPIANSITEAHVMQRYLRPDLLEAAGVLDFDTWAATFGRTTTEIELSVDGASFRLKSRFAKFHNVPELLRMWWVSGDVKTAEDLNLPRPELVARPEDGKRLPQTVLVPPTPELEQYIQELGRRAEKVTSGGVDRKTDNMLLISSEGRAAALDMRLVGRPMPPGESKLDIAADRIAETWAQHRNDRFTDRSGAQHPVPGALQIIFCDLGTPRSDRWNVYDELRDQLVARGLPREQVRFVHEARNDKEKGELFQSCVSGQVAVLIGSTGKMGVGTNVQDRAVALHHLDCPWRPADLAQRDGRALRRGNQYPEIGIYRYVTEGSFDGYSWQTVARKAAFIAQLMRGRLDVREIEDIGDSALSFNEISALAAGNPLLLEKAKADAELTRLERLDRAHIQSRTRLRYSIEQNQRAIVRLGEEITSIEQAIAQRCDTRGDNFRMIVDGRSYPERAAAGQALQEQLALTLNRPGPSPATIHRIAVLGGLTFDATIWRTKQRTGYELTINGLPHGPVGGSRTQLLESKPASLVIRLENRLTALDRNLAEAQQSLQTCRTEIDRAHTQLDQPFAHGEALEAARRHVADLERQLNDSLHEPAPPSPEAPFDAPDHDRRDGPAASASGDAEEPAASTPSSNGDSAAQAKVAAMPESGLRGRAREERRRMAAGEPPVDPATRDLVIARAAQLPDRQKTAFERELELVAQALRRGEAAGPSAPRTSHEHPIMADLRRDIANKIATYRQPISVQPNADAITSASASPTAGLPPDQRTSSGDAPPRHAARTAATVLHSSSATSRRPVEAPPEHRRPVVPPRCTPDPSIARSHDGRGR